MTVVERMSEILAERGISQLKLCKDIGISTGNYSDWKSGRSTPKLEVLNRIADYFNVSTDYLLGRTDIKGASPSSDELAPLLQKPLMKEIYDAAMQLSPENRRIILAQIEAVKALEEDAKK